MLIALRAPQSFPAAAPALRRDLERLSSEVNRLNTVLPTETSARPKPADKVSNSQTGSVGLGQFVVADPPLGSTVTVLLPSVVAADGGKVAYVAVRGLGIVRIVAPGGSLVNGYAAVNLHGIGLHPVMFDGSEFWTSPNASPDGEDPA